MVKQAQIVNQDRKLKGSKKKVQIVNQDIKLKGSRESTNSASEHKVERW